ncbi:MAG: metalloregulator ArsR/SmtB family transcription factor [Actinomycetota bacterium]|nr:metalloregulator ArsR/SmtB family transcription factor [Actinomycetota bacterium]
MHEAFARTAKALSSPKRVALAEQLAQDEHTVEGLAQAIGMRVTNTSAHLQVLARARLVAVVRKEGTRVVRRLSGDDVAAFVVALRDLARLPASSEVVAYCRGSYCLLALQAVERLRARYKARRLADGLPEWRLAGLPVAAGTERMA